MIEKVYNGVGGSGNDGGCLTCYLHASIAIIAEIL